MTLAKYKASYFIAYAFATTFPLTSQLIDGKLGFAAFPPVGDNPAPWILLAIMIPGVVGLLPYAWSPKLNSSVSTLAVATFSAMLILGYFYVSSAQSAIVPIHFSDGRMEFVVKGAIRNSELPKAELLKSDEDFIEDAGLHDSDLEAVYSPASIRHNRQLLFWTYLGTVTTFQFFLGLIVVLDGRRSKTR